MGQQLFESWRSLLRMVSVNDNHYRRDLSHISRDFVMPALIVAQASETRVNCRRRILRLQSLIPARCRLWPAPSSTDVSYWWDTQPTPVPWAKLRAYRFLRVSGRWVNSEWVLSFSQNKWHNRRYKFSSVKSYWSNRGCRRGRASC